MVRLGEMAASSQEMDLREKQVFVARQIHFANSLAGNDPKDRAKAMKNLRKFLTGRSTLCFTHDDFMRIWKGLFYCIWMSDKPLIQEELTEQISQLVHCFECVEVTLLFIQTCFDTLMTEWFGIDYHRLDKFQMFVRRFLRQSLVFCKNEEWDDFAVVELSNVFKSTVLSPSKCNNECSDIGLTMHFVDIFIEELSKVSAGELSNKTFLKFLEPFVAFYALQNDHRLQSVIRDRIFYNLIQQSPAGLEYEEKFEAWKRAGFPGNSWKDMVFVGKNDNRSGVKIKHLDPRAGKVNVYLPRIVFDALSVVKLLKKYSAKPLCAKKQRLRPIVQKFQNLAKDKYPLTMNVSKPLRDIEKYRFSKQMIDDAVDDLISFNKNLEESARKLENKGKRKRNKKSKDLKQPKKMKLEKEDYEKKDENSSDIENGGTKHCKERESSSKSKPQSKNVLKKRKKTKLQNNLSWNVSQISKLQNEEMNLNQTPKEVTEVENVISFQNLTGEGDLEIESTIPFHEPPQKEGKHVQSTDSSVVIMKEIEEMECSSQETDKYSIQKNESIDPNKKSIETSVCETQPYPDSNQPSPEMRDINVEVTQDQETNFASKTVESPHKTGEVTIPLRKSIRRRSSVVPEANESMKEKKEVNGFLVEDTSTPKSVKKTPKQSVKPKRKISKIFSPIEIEWEEVEEEGGGGEEEEEEENKLSAQTKSPLEQQISSAPETGIGTPERISTVPDREIVVEQERELQENPAYMPAPVTSGSKETVFSNNILKENEKLTSRRMSLRSLTRQKRASLHLTPKKVNIALQMNKSQDFTEYLEGVINSPTIQYDANKKPCKGVLKQTSIKSPINPFYKPPKGIRNIIYP